MSDEGVPAAGRPRRWPWAVAGGFIAVALAAGAGVLIGRATAPGPTIVVAPGPVVQQSPVASELPEADGRPDLIAGSTQQAAVPAVFTPDADLPDVESIASGYQFTTGGVDGAGLAKALANGFGSSGAAVQTADGWMVGSLDGNVPTVTVIDDPLLTWSFEDPEAAVATEGVAIDPDAARDQVETLLASIGVDTSSVDWQVDRFADHTKVTAWQLLNGSRTDLSWDVSLGKAGLVISAHGFAAGVVQIPGYRAVGAATAVERSAAPTWASLGPTPLPGEVSTGTPGSAVSPSAAPTVGARPALQAPLARILVEQAELGLAQFRQPDGAVLILPAYQLIGADGSRWSVIAVGAEDVDFVPVPYPSATSATP